MNTKKMSDSLEQYRQEINLLFTKGDSAPATKSDLEELSRQIYYVLNDVISNLEQN